MVNDCGGLSPIRSQSITHFPIFIFNLLVGSDDCRGAPSSSQLYSLTIIFAHLSFYSDVKFEAQLLGKQTSLNLCTDKALLNYA